MRQEQIIDEIRRIPSDRLQEIYDVIHYFRLGLSLKHEETPAPARALHTAEPGAARWLANWRGALRGKESPNDGDERSAHILHKHLY